MLDYGALPPEVTSTLMYTGPGSAPMTAAAGAWRAQAAEITSALSLYEAVISQLVDQEWMGQASASMAAAAEPHLAWMSGAAHQAEQNATQANAAAAAFETAHAAITPPAVVAANRAQHAVLVATNVLGQNTAAIAANEVQYAGFWANNSATMYGYAAASAAAAQLTPFSSPSQTTTPAAQLISTMPSALQGLASPMAASAPSAASGLSGINSGLGFLNTLGSNSGVATIVEGASTAVTYIPSTLIPTMVGFLSGSGFNAVGGGAAGAGLGALLGPGGALGGLGIGIGGAAGAASAAASTISATTPAVSASMGQAQLVGSLSAPSSWAPISSATEAGAAATGALPTNGWAAPPESHSMAAIPPGVPGTGRGGFGYGTPRYGSKLTVMPRQVVVG